MSHEQSETVERDGRYYNVYGRGTAKAGEVLPGEPPYDSLDAAVVAAKRRSQSFDKPARTPNSVTETALIDSYNARRSADFDAWMAQPSQAPSADNPRPTGGDVQLGLPSPPIPSAWQNFYSVMKAGVAGGFETAKSGVQNIGQGVADTLVPPTPPEDIAGQAAANARGAGQALLGLLELGSALPAGAAAAVRKAAQTYAPGMESAVALKGGSGSFVSYLRTMLMTPQIMLDPRFQGVDAQALLASLDAPMTYGELGEIATMVLAGVGQARALKGTAPFGRPTISSEGPKALPPAAYPTPPPAAYPTPPPRPPMTTAERFRQIVTDPELRALSERLRERYTQPTPKALPAAGETSTTRTPREFLRDAYKTPLDAAKRTFADERGSLTLDLDPAELKDAMRKVAELAPAAAREIADTTEKTGGATYSPLKSAMYAGDSGFAVGVSKDRGIVVDKLTPEVLRKFAADNADLLADERAHIGTWKDDAGKVHVDISAVLPTKEEALALGAAESQQAIWDFANKTEIPVPAPEAFKASGGSPPTEPVRLEHYSAQPNLEVLDPAKFGTGHAGRETARAGEPGFLPRSYAYLKGTQPEARFERMPKYQAELPADRPLIDLASETGRALRAEAGNDATKLESLIHERGYAGYHDTGLNLPESAAKYANTPGNVVALFEPLPVKRVLAETGETRLYRNGNGNLATPDLATARAGAEMPMYVDVPNADLSAIDVGNGHHYYLTEDAAKNLRPVVGDAVEKQIGLAKVVAAKQRLADTFQKVTADLTSEAGRVDVRGFDPENLKATLSKKSQFMNDLATVGAAVLWQGARDFKTFSTEMLREFGDKLAQIPAEIVPGLLKDAHDLAVVRLQKIVEGSSKLPSTRQLMKLFHKGEFGMEWYDKAWDELKRLFGPNAETFADALAATSPNQQVDANVTRALFAMEKILSGERSASIPFGERDGMMAAHYANLNRMLRGEPLSGPKVGAFARAIKGDRDAVVVDTWMLRAFGFLENAAEKIDPTPARVKFIQKIVPDMAAQLGVDARQVQAAIWIAKKIRDEGKYDAQHAWVNSEDVAARPLHEIIREKLREKLESGELDKTLFASPEEAAQAVPATERATFNAEDVPSWVTDEGKVEIGTLLTLARAVIGGAAGAATGDDFESSARNALIGMGLGAGLSRVMARRVLERLQSIDPEGAKLSTFTAGVDPSKLADVFKRIVRRNSSERDFNYGRMDTSTAAKNTIRTLDQQIEALKQFRSRTHAETVDLAKDSKYNAVSEILKLDADAPLNGPDAYAARGVLNHVAEEVIREAAVGDNPAKVRDLVGILGEVADRVKDVRTSIARAEESWRIPSRSNLTDKFDIDHVVKGIQETKVGLAQLSDVELMDAIKSMADTAKMTALARGVKRWPAAFWEMYYGLNLLSSPFTQVRNMIGNAGAVAFGVADRLAGELVATPFHLADAIFDTKSGAGRVQWGESIDLARDMVANVKDALRGAKKSWDTGESAFTGGNKTTEVLNDIGGISAANLGLEGALFGKFFDATGALARGNLRFMGSVDEFFKYINFAGELRALARREAGSRTDLTRTQRAELMSELQARPTAEILQQAQAFAKEQTFTKAFDPRTFGGKAEALAQSPAMRLLATPFFRTPMRIAEYQSVHTPGLNLLAKQFWSDLAEGGAKADLAFGKLAVGGAILYTVAQAAQDGYIVGTRPADAALGKRMEDAMGGPNWKSIYNPWNGKYYSYDNLEPVSGIMASVADFVRMSGELNDPAVEQLALAWTVALAHNAVAKQWWQPVSDVLDAIDGFGKGTDSGITQALKYAANRLNSLTPGAGLLRTARPFVDPVVREPRTLLDFYANQTPGWSKSVPARKNMITGEPILYEGVFSDDAYLAGLSPFRVTTNPGDPVLNEIVIQKGAGLPREIPRVLGGTRPPDGVRVTEPNAREGVLLSDTQRTRLTELITQDVKDPFGLTLHKALTSLVSETGPYAALRYKSDYADADDGRDSGRALLVYKIWRQFLVQAENRLLEEDKPLAEQVRRRKLARELQKLPTAVKQTLQGVLQ